MSEPQTITPFEIKPEIKAEIDQWVAKYPPEQKRSAVVSALLLVQEQNHGWLSEAAMQAVADYLELPAIMVYEVATFYDMYELKPIGKHKIGICTNVSCLLRGVEDVVDTLKTELGVGLGETTPDGLITLRETECLGACCHAPVCQVDDKTYHENLTPESMRQLIRDLKQKAHAAQQQSAQQESDDAV